MIIGDAGDAFWTALSSRMWSKASELSYEGSSAVVLALETQPMRPTVIPETGFFFMIEPFQVPVGEGAPKILHFHAQMA